jgi:hypothetical protein
MDYRAVAPELGTLEDLRALALQGRGHRAVSEPTSNPIIAEKTSIKVNPSLFGCPSGRMTRARTDYGLRATAWTTAPTPSWNGPS